MDVRFKHLQTSLQLPFCLKGAFQFPAIGLVYSPLAKPHSVRKGNERAITDCVFHGLCIIKLFVQPFSQQTIGREEFSHYPLQSASVKCLILAVSDSC